MTNDLFCSPVEDCNGGQIVTESGDCQDCPISTLPDGDQRKCLPVNVDQERQNFYGALAIAPIHDQRLIGVDYSNAENKKIDQYWDSTNYLGGQIAGDNL